MEQQTNMTAVQWLYNKMYAHRGNITIEEYEQAKQMEKEQITDHLIGFQIYLNNKKLITNHDWDFEKLAKEYIKKEYK